MDNSVKVTCKKCGRQAPSSDFSLDSVFGMVVCKNCIKDRKSGIAKKEIGSIGIHGRQKETSAHEIDSGEYEEIVHGKQGQSKASKPVDWDSVDEELERAAREKEQKKSAISVLPDGRLLVTCRKCKFQFKYNKQKGVPNTCPYCATSVSLIGL